MSLLTAEQQGDLVVASLNLLPHPEDLAEKREWAHGCCPECCAPCGVLSELVQAERIDDAVLASRVFNSGTWAWWVPGEGVNRAWLAEAWKRCTAEVPGHPDGSGGVYPAYDD